MKTQPFANSAANGKRLQIADSKGASMSRRKVLAGWRNEAFADAFSKGLAGAPYTAFLWETPALTAATLDQPFECQLTPSAELASRPADAGPFAALISAPEDDVIATRSIGGDAELVIPCDRGGDYAHFASFLRSASPEQKRRLWAKVAEVALRWLDAAPERPIWVSTSGLGVAWLHVRIDSQPKYYAHAPYRNHGK